MRISTLRRQLVLALATLALPLLARPARAVDLLSENFDQLPLNQVVTFQSEVRHRAAWTATPPSGAGVEGTWTVDNSLMPPASTSDLIGVAEFEGWTFVDRDWWIDTAGDQDRRLFVSASGTIAVADPDEWDDFGTPAPTSNGQQFDSTLRVSGIPLQGVAPNTARLFFHSSWRPEDTQKVSLTVKYNDPGATMIELFRWTSQENDPNFKPDAVNEAINIPVLNPAGATTATLEFRMFEATNDWWWAIDNLSMFTGAAPALDGALRLTINRDTQEVKIVNNTANSINLRGYSIESRFGTLNEGAATYLGDTNPNWQILDSPTGSELSEGYIPDQYLMPTLAANPTLGQINLGPAWNKYHEDISDISFQYLIAGSNTPKVGIIEFVGNNGESFDPLDLNFDGMISLLDYAAFLQGYNVSLAGKTAAQQHILGDLDADQKHTVRDFLLFKQEFNAALGAGAFEAMIAAPEPAAAMLLASAAVIGLAAGRRCRRVVAPLAVAVALSTGVAGRALANLPLLVENFDGITLEASPDERPTALNVWNGTGPAGWTVDDSGVPGVGNNDTDGVTDWAGWAFVKKDFWISADDQGRSMFTKGSGNVMVADPDEWQDKPIMPIQLYDAFVSTPTINIPAGVPAGKIRLAFDSSWRPEGADETGTPEIGTTNNQTATVTVSYNGGPKTNIFTWSSLTTDATYKEAAENESVDFNLNYNGSTTTLKIEFGLGKAWNDWWWAVDNIRVFVPADPSILRINTTTGLASIIGGDVISTSITSYDMSSVNGNFAPSGNLGLSFTKPDSIDGSDPDSIVGNSINETWQLGAANPNQFAEFFLDGSSAFDSSRTESLGQIFNPATPEAMRDVQFEYTTIFGDVIPGIVQYVSTPADADFDNDGDVDGADFLRWQRGLGTGTTNAQGDADGDNDVDGADLAIWKLKFGQPVAVANAGAVPEPASGALATALLGAALVGARNRRRRKYVLASAAMVVAASALSAAPQARAQAIPAPFLDRDYRMGNSDPGAVNGGAVSVTFDSAGLPGMNQLIDMTGNTRAGGNPTYITIAGRPDGGTGLGIRLNPNPTDRQYLRTGQDEALNFPERSPSSTEGTIAGGTIDYTYITDRGFQLWVQPIAANEAHIVMDSNNHGAIITAAGKFGMRYSNFDYSGVTAVVPNAWYHLMVVRAFGDRGTGSVLYVNGVAEAAATGIYNGEDAPNDEMNPANHDNSPLVVGSTTSESPFQVGTQRYFRGIVDDLKMFVMGLNATRDFGEFSFQRDNDYAAHFAPTTPGDLNGDNMITMVDVTTFAANWRAEKTLTWMQGGTERTLAVGDLQSRMMGDFNYDGRVNLADWAILNTANPAMGAAAMQLIQGVPEPSTLALAAGSLALAAGVRRKQSSQRRKSSLELRSA